MDRRKSVARQRAARIEHSPPGVASELIWHLPDLIECHGSLPVVILARVSAREQDRTGNLTPQVDYLERAAKLHELKIVKILREVGSGWRMDDRSVLTHALDVAREHGAILLVESTCRLIRSTDFHNSQNPGAVPTKAEFEFLRELAGNVPLATVLRPDTPWEYVRSHQTRRGQVAKDAKGGRPRAVRAGDKKRRRQELQVRVRRLYGRGLSLADLPSFFDVPRSTLHDWLKLPKKPR